MICGLIDMDGVLVDSEHVHGEQWRETAVELGFPAERIDLSQFLGVPELQSARRLASELGPTAPAPEEIVRRKQARYAAGLSQLQLIDGARDFLEACRGAGIRLALVTSGLRANQRFLFEHHALQPFFEVVITGEDITAGKPSPEPYLRALALLHIGATDAFVVEDSLAGVASGKAAGCFVSAVAHSFPGPELLAAGADLVAPTIRDFTRWIALLSRPRGKVSAASAADSACE
jgi:HAD superfamily hydrolase (TIGR01509 family)